MKFRILSILSLAALCASGTGSNGSNGYVPRSAPPLNRLPAPQVRFEPNRGQAPSGVTFIGRAKHYMVLFGKGSTRLLLRNEEDDAGREIILAFAGANPDVDPHGADRLQATTNYFTGNDPLTWRHGIPNYGRIVEPQLYPGIDAVFHSDGDSIEYDFVVSPHSDLRSIRMRVDDAEISRNDESLVMTSHGASIRMAPPVAYQTVGGERRLVEVQYVVAAGPVIGFDVGEYDHSRELVIDPTLVFSTYLGGSGEDVGNFVTTDSWGNSYVVGRTTSSNFPAVDAWQGSRAGARDAFVTKYSAAGQMLYSTYFGGAGAENPLGVALASDGAISVTGVTASTNMPVANAMQPVYGGGMQDGFIFTLTPDGSNLVYSTYLGGAGFDQSRSIAVDRDGNAYVAGNTDSADFPRSNALQPDFAGGVSDAFVAKLDSAGGLVFSTYLGGNNYDGARAVALDPAGNIYVAGETRGGFPVTPGAFQTAYGGGLNDLFVAKLSADGAQVLYATYIGGSGTDQNQITIGTSAGIHGKILAVDRDGNAYVAGDTDSSDFPVKNAYQAVKSGDVDVFVLQLNEAGTDLVYSTYFGGSGFDTARGIALTTGGRVWIAGSTRSTDLPTRNPFQAAFGGGAFDALIAEFSRRGQLRFSTYWGGSGVDAGWNVATDSVDGVTVTGETTSADFPTFNAAQTFSGGGTADAFVLRLQLE